MTGIRKTIILVDDDITNLTVGKSILSETYNVFTVHSGERLLAMLPKIEPDLILLDVEMPEMSGYSVIKQLKSNRGTESIPVIFLTAKSDPFDELEGLTLGAIDYITKPFSPMLLKKRIEVHLLVESQKHELQDYNENLQKKVKEKTRTVMDLQNTVLQTIADLVECRDDDTGGHIERTQNYLRILVTALSESNRYRDEVSGWSIDFFLHSAQLHDVGKIMIRDSILRKPGKLTADEFEEMKAHAAFGEKIIERIQQSTPESAFLSHAKILAGTHHEKWDGTGYPRGLKDYEIPLQGRLMALADVYDALVSERPYKSAMTHDRAVQIIAEGRGSHFDPLLVDIFLSIAPQFDAVATGFGLESKDAAV